MTEKNIPNNSELIGVLREGIGVVQMVIFKELRDLFAARYKDRDIPYRSMLIGALINQIFGTVNPEEKFQRFNRENCAEIEQELIGLSTELAHLRPYITDALRVQALCDNQEGSDSSQPLVQAEQLGLLMMDRDVPLPSIFMTRIRELGNKHGLTIAPVQISPDEDGVIH